MSTFNELIDFTRSTTGTYLDSVVYGDELVTNGNFSDGTTGWSSYRGATLSASGGSFVVSANTGSYGGSGSQGITTVAGKTYTLSFQFISATASNSYVAVRTNPNVGGGTTIAGVTTSGLSAGMHSATFTATGTTTYITVVAQNPNDVTTVDNISVKEIIGGQVSGTPLLRTAAINEPRLEYDASGNPLGLLIEEARTNLLQYSEDFAGSYWTKGSITISPNNAIAPDGSASADKIVPNAINDRNHIIYKNITRSTLDAFSLFVKPAGFDYVSLILQASANTDSMGVQFNLLTGTVVTSQNANGIIQDVGNGWYRVTVTPTTSTTFYYAVIQPNDGTAPNTSDFFRSTFTGNGSDGVYLWGAQFEQGAFPTSYIPTSGSTVTRNSDLAPIPVERFAFNASEGTLFVHAVTAAGINATTGQCAVSMSSGSVTDCYRLRKNVSTGQIGMLKRVSDSNVMNINGKIVGETSTFKACGNYSSTNLNISIDGEDVITGSASSSTITISKVDVGTSPFGDADCFNGHIKQIQYYPKRLSNTELQLLTQPSASPTMNLTFDGQATSTLVEGLHD